MIRVEIAQAARIDGGRKLVPDLKRDIGVLFGRMAQLQIEAAAGLFFEWAPGGIGIQEEGIKHYVVIKALRVDAQSRRVREAHFLHRTQSWERRHLRATA